MCTLAAGLDTKESGKPAKSARYGLKKRIRLAKRAGVEQSVSDPVAGADCSLVTSEKVVPHGVITILDCEPVHDDDAVQSCTVANSISNDSSDPTGTSKTKRIRKKKENKYKGELLLTATVRGDIALMKRLRELRHAWNRNTCTAAVQAEQFEALKYARENGCPWDNTVCEAAVIVGRMDILQYAIESGCPEGKSLLKLAVQHGRDDMIVYLHERGCKFDQSLRLLYVTTANMSGLQAMVKCKCPFSVEMCARAARCGLTDVLRFLHENGGAIDQEVCLAAVQCGHLACVQYALGHGCVVTEVLVAEAMKTQHTHIVDYLVGISSALYDKPLLSDVEVDTII